MLRVHKSAWKKVKPKEKPFWKIYCDQASIHGLRYLSDENSPRYEKLTWTVIVLSSIACTIIMYVALTEQYSVRNLQTVVDNSQHPIYYMYFPSVAICAQNHIPVDQLQLAQKHFMPHANETTAEAFVTFLKYFNKFQFGTFKNMDGIQFLDLRRFDQFNLTSLAEFMLRPCEDYFQKCIWRNVEVPCCEYFVTQVTEVGFCYVFNSMVTEEAKRNSSSNHFYPFRESNGGEQSGLKVHIKSNHTRDMSFMIKRPQEWSRPVHLLHINTEIFCVLRPKVTIADDDVKRLPPEKRNCIFSDETSHPLYKSIKGLDYRMSNCLTKCHAAYAHRYCNCSIPLFFPEESDHSNLTACKASDLPCFLKYEGVFSYEKQPKQDMYVKELKEGMVCQCLPGCDEIVYSEYVTNYPFNSPKNMTHSAILNVYFESEVSVKYRTKLEYSTVDLIANFGAILGLFLGASIMSGIEFTYFLALGVWSSVKTHLRKRSLA